MVTNNEEGNRAAGVAWYLPSHTATGLLAIAVCSAIVCTRPALCQGLAELDSAGFLTRLGQDTIAVERVVIGRDSIVGEVLARAIAPGRWSYVAQLGPDYRLNSYRVVLPTEPGPNPEHSVVTIDFQRDSAYVTLRRGDSAFTRVVRAPPGTVPLREPSFGLHLIPIARALAAHGASVPFAWYTGGNHFEPASATTNPLGDTVLLTTRTDKIRAALDAQMHVTGFSDPGGTFQVRVARVAWPDLDHWAGIFAGQRGSLASSGVLSPRDTVRATIGGTGILIDYGRPSVRGRKIFGEVIPWNSIWRTGANAATTLVVDGNLRIGDVRVPGGTYTLFSTLQPGEWTLILSRETGEWGTDYNGRADLARVPMEVSTQASPVERFTIAIEPQTGPDGLSTSGELTFAWDTLIARVGVRALAK